MMLLGDFWHVLRIALPAILTLAVLDAAIVAWCVHAAWADSSRLTVLFLRDAGWNSLVLLASSLVLAGVGTLSMRGLGARVGLDARRVALFVAVGLGSLLALVSIHHALEASLAESSTRSRTYSAFGVWVLCVLGIGLKQSRSRLAWLRTVGAVAMVAAVPLFLGVRVDLAGGGALALAPTEREAEGLPLTDTIVLITLDTTRFDAVGYSNSGRTQTPALDRLAREGAVYEQATTPTPLTLPSHTSMMTGLTPWDHGVVVNGARVPSDLPVLAETLSAAGWRTGAFVAAPVVEAQTGLARGFQVFDGVMSSSPLPAKAMATTRIMRRLGVYRYPHVRPGQAVTDAALAWLSAGDGRPEFIWVHLFDSHAPYQASAPSTCPHADQLAMLPPGRAEEYDRTQKAPDWYADHMHELYDREVEGMDRQVGRIVDALEDTGRLESSMIVVIADHGESFESPKRFDHAATLTNQTLRVPLVVRLPGAVDAGVRSRDLVSVEDVYATVLEAAGAPREGPSARSRSLLVPFLRPTDAAPRAFTRHETFPHPMASSGERLIAARTARSMLVVSPERDRREFFHLDEESSRDRLGDTERSAELADLVDLLEAGEGPSRTRRMAEVELLEDRETVEMLRSLGYVN